MSLVKIAAILIAVAFCCAFSASSYICGQTPAGKVCTGTAVSVSQVYGDPWEISKNNEKQSLAVEIKNIANRSINNLTFINVFPKNVKFVGATIQEPNKRTRLATIMKNISDGIETIQLSLGDLNASSYLDVNLTTEYNNSDLIDLGDNEIQISADPMPLPSAPKNELVEKAPVESPASSSDSNKGETSKIDFFKYNLSNDELELLKTGPRLTAIGQFDKPKNGNVNYIILVKNSGDVELNPVILEVVLPEGSDISATSKDPAKRNDQVIYYNIGSLAPSEGWDLVLQLVPNSTAISTADEAALKNELQKLMIKAFANYNNNKVIAFGQASQSVEWEDEGY
jgi:hypothetical protein